MFSFFDNDTIHPSYLTFIPILGVFLIIHFIESNNLIFKFLTNRLISKIGISDIISFFWLILPKFLRIFYATVKLSPHPQRAISLGLLNSKPELNFCSL